MSICFTIQKMVQALVRVDPVLLTLGPLEIRWYALAYAFGALYAVWFVGRAGGFHVTHKRFLDSLMSWSLVSTIACGRMGYVLFYGRSFFLMYPAAIFQIWNGGMSFHGGLIGCIAGVYFVCRKYKMPFLHIADLLACALPAGIFLGRLANLVNGELYGKTTTSCLGTVFAEAGDMLPRHPTQIYEAFAEGLLPFIFLNMLYFLTKIKTYNGLLLCIFCLWYSSCRFAVEFLREPDIQLGYLAFGWLTMGQMLTLPLFAAAMTSTILILKSKARTKCPV